MKTSKCRKTLFRITIQHLSTLAKQILSAPVLGKIIFYCLPAFIFGCSRPEETQVLQTTTVRMMENDTRALSGQHTIDILTFNDDRLQRLDTYQRSENTTCSTVEAASTAGNKIMTAIINSGIERYGWAGINSREALAGIRARLENEQREKPVMSGECHVTAGKSANIILRRLRSDIVIRSLRCDFRESSYDGKRILDAKVYLINVNAEASLIDTGNGLPERIINSGRYDPNAAACFKEPELIFHDIPEGIGPEAIYPGICLSCYQNESERETPGTPFTRLVIEGSIEGHTYYWPIDINRENGGNGIVRNNRYIYDITITETGTSDPDRPIGRNEASIRMEVKEWSEREDYGVRF